MESIASTKREVLQAGHHKKTRRKVLTIEILEGADFGYKTYFHYNHIIIMILHYYFYKYYMYYNYNQNWLHR